MPTAYTWQNSVVKISSIEYTFTTSVSVSETHNVKTIKDRKQNEKILDMGWVYTIQIARWRVDSTFRGLPKTADIYISNDSGNVTFPSSTLTSGTYNEVSEVLSDTVTYRCYSKTKIY